VPHPGTHISALQMLAAETPAGHMSLADVLGGTRAEPLAAADAAMVLRHRYACFGAVGPDLLYFMMDFNEMGQTAQNLICQLFATMRAFERVSNTVGKIWDKALETGDKADFCGALGLLDDIDSELSDTLNLGVGIATTGLEALATGGLGLNLFAIITAPRQENKPPNEWFWADHLHYVNTGNFTHNLLDLAFLEPKYRDHPEMRAYALGYLTHFVADVIGHPYVNQIVGGPYRLHRQRHTLTENFIDSWVWSHCHTKTPDRPGIVGDTNPLTGRKWQDTATRPGTRDDFDADAAYYRCRLNEFVDVGGGGGFSEAIEGALDDLADAFEDGSDLAFGTETVKIEDDALFGVWSEMFLDALHKTYDSAPSHPTRLPDDGFPRKADIASAYATCLAFLRMATNSAIEKPEFPDLSGVSDAVRKAVSNLVDGISDALEGLDPHLGGSFSLSSLFDWVKSVFEAAIKIIKAVLNALRDLCHGATELVEALLKVMFYLIKMPLWAVYSALYRVLELRGYAQPLPGTLNEHESLWRNRVNDTRRFAYPVMEVRAPARPAAMPTTMTTIAQDQLFTSLDPRDDPADDPGRNLELPTVAAIGQDFQVPGAGGPGTPATPSELLFAPRGPDDMFAKDGPLPLPVEPPALAFSSHPPVRRYGGIVPNCRHAMDAILTQANKPGATTVVPDTLFLANYNLDGDRGLGWISWNLASGSGQLRPGADVDTTVIANSFEG
jgi:hypothetical protein